MVDGPRNAVYEVDSAAVPPGPANPNGNAWVVHRRLRARESEACRDADPLAGRYWLVTSAEARNALGEPTAYKLVPGENVRALAHRDSSVTRRAGFMTHHLWVTRHDPAERYAAGDYPNQHPGGAGLPAYVAADRPLENQDVVLWYSLGAQRGTRVWPGTMTSMPGACPRPGRRGSSGCGPGGRVNVREPGRDRVDAYRRRAATQVLEAEVVERESVEICEPRQCVARREERAPEFARRLFDA
jgi:hypothetical protein